MAGYEPWMFIFHNKYEGWKSATRWGLSHQPVIHQAIICFLKVTPLGCGWLVFSRSRPLLIYLSCLGFILCRFERVCLLGKQHHVEKTNEVVVGWEVSHRVQWVSEWVSERWSCCRSCCVWRNQSWIMRQGNSVWQLPMDKFLPTSFRYLGDFREMTGS